MALRRVTCSAVIQDDNERKLVVDWVKSVANRGYSEDGDRVTLTYEELPGDHDSSYWAIVHFFEGCESHEITSVDAERN